MPGSGCGWLRLHSGCSAFTCSRRPPTGARLVARSWSEAVRHPALCAGAPPTEPRHGSGHVGQDAGRQARFAERAREDRADAGSVGGVERVPLDMAKHSPKSMAVPNRTAQLSFTDYRKRTGRGGPRPGAGRPRGPAAARAAPRARGGARGAAPCTCTLRVRPGVRFAARRRAGPRVAALAVRGERARQLPGRALLAPRRSRASDRRGAGEGSARVRHEEHRGSPRARRESRQRAQRAGARRPLPPPQPPLAARGAARACLRAAERAATPREEPRHPAGSATAHLDGASSARWFDGWRQETASRIPEARTPGVTCPTRPAGCCASGGDVTASWIPRRSPANRLRLLSGLPPHSRIRSAPNAPGRDN